MVFYLFLVFIISGAWCQRTEQIVISPGQSISFDCQLDESIYFARRLGDWSEIQENNEKYLSLNLNFNYLKNEKILRVTSNSAQLQNIGYYGCRKATRSKPIMNRIYQFVLADVQLFYWTYVCHGPAGSCLRYDDITDENLSTFEVVDQTRVDLYCCASVTGYKNVNMNMNRIGEIRGKIDVKRKQELDGSLVVCANQHTLLKRTSSRNPETLTCELTTDNQPYSSFSTIVVIKDAIVADRDDDPADGYTPTSNNDDSRYFNGAGRQWKLMTGKRVITIVGFIVGGLTFSGLLFALIYCLHRNNREEESTDL